MLNENEIREALQAVKYPGFSRDIVSFGLVKAVEISDGKVCVRLVVTTNEPKVPEQIRSEAQRVIGSLPGVRDAHVQVEVHSASSTSTTAFIEGVRYVIAVASGKGGVGKSTVAANLAVALHHTGVRVGLCDCDIYGPSIALMFGSNERPYADEQNRIIPIERYGIQLMSMGFLLENQTPAILRGPLVTRYTQQFLRHVDWRGLDYLLLDLPPGTGDIQLTIVQTIMLSGAIIVTTPQEVALIDARKAASMFAKTHVPVLGIIENMSYFLCPSDGKKYEIFGSGGGKREARRLGVPLLAEIPIQSDVCIAADQGRPLFDQMPNSVVSQAFASAARSIQEAVEKTNAEST